MRSTTSLSPSSVRATLPDTATPVTSSTWPPSGKRGRVVRRSAPGHAAQSVDADLDVTNTQPGSALGARPLSTIGAVSRYTNRFAGHTHH
jgi:hypothetical protein